MIEYHAPIIKMPAMMVAVIDPETVSVATKRPIEDWTMMRSVVVVLSKIVACMGAPGMGLVRSGRRGESRGGRLGRGGIPCLSLS